MALLEFSLEVGDKKTRIINGIAGQHGYQDEVEVDEVMVPNPETKGEFVKRMVIGWVKENVKAYEVNLASKTARETAIADADTISVE